MTTPLGIETLGEGWTATTTYSAGGEIHAGFIRRVEQVRVLFAHELGGRAEALFTAPVGAGVYRLAQARVWAVCTDPVCRTRRGFQHALTEPTCITGDELRVLVTDDVALAM